MLQIKKVFYQEDVLAVIIISSQLIEVPLNFFMKIHTLLSYCALETKFVILP